MDFRLTQQYNTTIILKLICFPMSLFSIKPIGFNFQCSIENQVPINMLSSHSNSAELHVKEKERDKERQDWDRSRLWEVNKLLYYTFCVYDIIIEWSQWRGFHKIRTVYKGKRYVPALYTGSLPQSSSTREIIINSLAQRYTAVSSLVHFCFACLDIL